jgi:hypothetical protein
MNTSALFLLHKVRPCRGNMRSSNRAVVRPMNADLFALSELDIKFSHNLQHKLAMTEIMCVVFLVKRYLT